MDTIPLARASLCLDCERIRPSEARGCPACGSHHAVLLARWLDRKEAA
jgi:RNA polymerase subunit RPABC4/transcription elongation factor Spt4